MAKILITGASGNVGGRLVRQLSQLGAPVVAAVREPARYAGSASVRFDFERPETFAGALAEVDRVFLIARPGDERADAVSIPLIDAMKQRGVRRVVNLSALGSERLELLPALRKIELHLERSGFLCTQLRPGFFMQLFSTPPILSWLRARGALALPAGDAKLAFVDAEDVAAVACAALLDDAHVGKRYTLTGPAALDHAEALATISALTGRTFHYQSVDETAFSALLRQLGLEPARVERLLRFYRVVREGAASAISSDVSAVLGRPARSFREFAQAACAAWT